MKENFQIHIWLGLLLCLLGMSCSDDTPAKGDDPGNGNTELEVNEWIESVMRSDYLWNNDIPAQNKLDFSADPQTFFRSMLSLKYNPQIQISAESGTKRSIFRQKNKTKRSKKRLHTTLIKPEQKVNEDLCSGFIVS